MKPTLEGLICDEYGLVFTHTTIEGMSVKNETVCEPYVIHTGTIGVGQKAVITLWYKLQHQPFNDDCYFWCTTDGLIPKKTTLPQQYNLVSSN
jgi:hypothetical protein